MTINVAFLTPMTDAVRDVVRRCAYADQSLHFSDTTDPEEHRRLVRDADVIVSAGSRVSADLIAAAPRLSFIQKWGIGVDKIDLNAARVHGIPVAITAGASAAPVAEHALALMLAVYRRLPLADRQVREGIWEPANLRAVCHQITGRTIGLLGFGNIARMLAHRLRGFDVRLIYHDPRRADAVTERTVAARYVDFDVLLAESDILSLHLPLTDESRGLIDGPALAAMKPGAVLINTARGEIVDEPALVLALQSGHLGGAGLDTLAEEPALSSNPLLRLDNVVVTPHSAGSVIDNVPNIAGHVFSNIDRHVRGLPLAEADIVLRAPASVNS